MSMAQAQAVTANGSFIAPNGIIYLVEEDVEAYFAGTLVFNYGSSLPVTRNVEILTQGLLGI
jgi:hypothetical protein